MNAAEAIAEILKREGIEFLSCYPRQALIEAAAKAGIRPLLCRQERMGIAIADGFSRATNGKRIGVFTMQQAAGTENAFPGAAQAFSDNTPILLIPSGEGSERRFIAPTFSATENYRNVCKWVVTVGAADQVPEVFRRAFYALRTGKGGPVLVEVPREVWGQTLTRPLDYTPVRGNRIGPDAAEIREVAKALLAAKRLVIHAGQGVLYAEAWDELRRLAEALDAPVMTTMPGKSAFPEDHALALGASAVSTTRQTAHFLARSDVIFGIGTSFTRTPYGRTMPAGKTMIHATLDAADINKDYKADLGLVGDAKLTLAALLAEIGTATKSNGTAAELAAIKKAWLAEWEPEFSSNETPMTPYRVIRDLMRSVDAATTIVTHDAGSPRDQIVPFWQSTKPRTYLGWGKSTQLGYGLGLIMGAKLARPDALCVNLMGDAAIGMTGMDFETAVRNRIGILTIVLNNGAMAIERDSMPFAIEKFNADKQGGNYRDVAKALGGFAIRVEKPAEIAPALNEAIAITRAGRPALVECMTKEAHNFSKYP